MSTAARPSARRAPAAQVPAPPGATTATVCAADTARPRLQLEAALRARGQGPAELAAAAAVPEAVVRALLVGDVAPEPQALARLGAAIGAERSAWSWALGAAICSLTLADAQASLRGRLWRDLILQGEAIADYARRHGVAERSLRLALATGRASRQLRASSIPPALGFRAGDLDRHASEGGTVHPALAQLVGRQLHACGWTRRGLAAAVGVAPHTVALLARGIVPRVLNPLVVGPLAARLRIDHGQFSHQLALGWRTATSNQGTLKYLLIRHCFTHGYPLDTLPARLGASEDQVRLLLGGRGFPERGLLDALRAELTVADADWEAAVQRQYERQFATSIALASLDPPPLHELVLAAAESEQGCDYLRWGARHGLRPRTLDALITERRAPRRVELRAVLIRALGIDRATYDAAVRRMVATAPPRCASPADAAARTAVQQRLLALMRERGLTRAGLGRAIGLGRASLERLLRHGARELRPVLREKVRSYLGLDHQDFARAVQEDPADEAPEDDSELQLLRHFRSLPRMDRSAVLAACGRLLERTLPHRLGR